MTEPKTRPTGASVDDFLAAAPANRRDDARLISQMMAEITGEPPVMWGPSIVGFGTYRYAYASGRTGDWPVVGFSPRKASLVLYVSRDFQGADELLARLGRHEVSQACLYVKRLSDLDLDVLRELITRGVANMADVRVSRA
jgi:hypothetical protein